MAHFAFLVCFFLCYIFIKSWKHFYSLKSKVKKEAVKWAGINWHWLWLNNHRRLNNYRRSVSRNSVVSIEIWIRSVIIIIKTKTMLLLNSWLLRLLRLLPLLFSRNCRSCYRRSCKISGLGTGGSQGKQRVGLGCPVYGRQPGSHPLPARDHQHPSPVPFDEITLWHHTPASD